MSLREISLFPTQDEFLWCELPTACWIGGRGCGKTFTGALWVLNQAMMYPGSHGVVASATGTQLKQATIPDFKEVFDAIGVQYNYSEWRGVVEFSNGSWFKFQSLDVPEDQVKGGNIGYLLIDEVDACPEGHIKKLKLAVRAANGPCQTRFIGNSPPPRHWLEKWFILEVAKSHGRKAVMGPLMQSSTFENVTLRKDYIEQALIDNPPGTPDYRRWIMGEMGVPLEGAVYPEFDETRHVIPWADVPFNRARAYVNGLDLGYEAHTVLLRAMVDDRDRMFVFGEHAGRMLLLEDHAEMIRTLLNQDPGGLGEWGTIYADHDAQDRAELAVMDIPTYPANKKEKMAGVDAVRKRFREDKLFFVQDKCSRSMLEIPYYVMDPKKDEPVKKEDHAMDALRYMVASYDLDHEDEIF